MSSFDRPLTGSPLVFSLDAELAAARAAGGTGRRTARTLVKDGPLRVTLIILDAGGRMAEHAAGGPIMVQVLEGSATMGTPDGRYVLDAGDVLCAPGGMRHDVESENGCTLLLTIANA